jgi:hypothetical protein
MITITPQPAPWCELKAGCASLPSFGIQPVVLDVNGNELQVSLVVDVAPVECDHARVMCIKWAGRER